LCDTLQAGISGGGSLPMHIDKFFEVKYSDNQYIF